MLWSLLFIAAAVYVGISLSLYLFQSRLVFFPDRQMAATPKAIGLDYEDVYVQSGDGPRIHAWFVPAKNARYTLLFCHGNAGNISHRLESLLIFHRLGLSSLIFDYAGYGLSEGAPSEAQTYRDAEAAWRYLVEERGMQPQSIVIFGRSLGGAVATWLAAKVNAAALITESAFTSVPDMGAALYPILPVRLLARIRYDTRERIRLVNSPVLTIHSRDDEMIPFAHGQALYESASEPKTFLEIRGGHNDGFLVSGDQYVRGIESFLARAPDS